jgi:hypothetical protein
MYERSRLTGKKEAFQLTIVSRRFMQLGLYTKEICTVRTPSDRGRGFTHFRYLFMSTTLFPYLTQRTIMTKSMIDNLIYIDDYIDSKSSISKTKKLGM